MQDGCAAQKNTERALRRMQEGWTARKNKVKALRRIQDGWRVKKNAGSFESLEKCRMLGGLAKCRKVGGLRRMGRYYLNSFFV